MIPVMVVGLGMGPQDITAQAAQAIGQAQVLAGGRRLLAWFPQHPAPRLPITGGLEAWLEQVAQAAGQNRVTVLASGDPGHFGVAARLRARLGPSAVRVIPGITAVQAACARLGLDWQGAQVVSLHGRALELLFSALSRADLVAVYTDERHPPRELARRLLERGQEGWQMHVAQELGGLREKLDTYTLEQAASISCAPLNLVLLQRCSWTQTLGLGLPEEAFGRQGGLITKREIRAVALALLSLESRHCMWDLGAGSGSVGLEASRLLWQGSVIAVERHSGRADLIAQNRRAFGAANLELVRGEMPQALQDLPDPDRVFIGGGGPDLGAICQEVAQRLLPGGVAVCAAIRLESLHEARQSWSRAGLTLETTQVQVSRDRSLGGGSYLKALNPVWLIRAAKKEA